MKQRIKCSKCGHATEDLTGQVFGRLTVIEHVCPVDYNARWRCRCRCGQSLVVPASKLKSGHTASCGCRRRGHNEIIIDGSVVHIVLASGRLAIVDAEDIGKVSQWCWCDNKPYITARGRHVRHIRLCWFVLDSDPAKAPGFVVDHIDGDPLNNRKSNLQICLQSSNNQRARVRLGKSGFIGVYRAHNMFRALTRYKKKDIYLGHFQTAEEAARAYDKKVLELHGPHARVNFPVGES